MEYKDKIINILNQGGDGTVSGLKDEFDLTVYLLHLATVESGWSCIGIEESAKDTNKNDSNNKPPAGWNANKDAFTLVYKNNKDPAVTFVLKCLRIGHTLLVNAMQHHSPAKIYTLDIDITQLVNPSFKLMANYKDAFKHLDQLLALYETSILVNVAPDSPLKESSHSASSSQSRRHPEQEHSSTHMDHPPQSHNPPPMVSPVGGGGIGGYPLGGGRPQFSTGDSDLYPTGLPNLPNMVGGGSFRPNFPGAGTSIGPNHPGFGRVHFPHGDDSSGLPFGERLPRGAVPPGARFDPFGPPGSKPSGRQGGYGDEMPPPGFNVNIIE
ncbi:proteasome inhibitor PI31 subunit [Heterostelium album PN500]|uniref:Proteasome inhibitor PI31 subunit n=1 Tax=Heterostelium pallidum (strain ATCC 26659 / Pp 5 / PN500) TaxID=670386 RepID=D3BG98_HETP5|nr:proteasome inhibitor PI31 subunit [Heterostelium album PN500]EFA79498.1 proteasome inhibitor PI31 subunit [Heterostelium album PN500]|eukprot:XP_020431619.1 proteasome inhibitor PI31 subunit [Heterostelium album PN500]